MVSGRKTAREQIVKKTLLAILLFALALGVAQAQKITAAGATFPYPIYSKWFSEYSAAHPGVEINYQSIGSGGGIQQVTSGVVDFGASDMPMTDEHAGSVQGQADSHSHRAGRRCAGLQCSRRHRSSLQPGRSGRHLPGPRSPTGTIRASPRTTPASSCPTRRSLWFTVPTAAALPSSGPTT